MSQPFPIARASSLVLFALLGLALPSMGCGLLIDKPPPEPSVNPDGGADASRDARAGDATVDATVDAPPACVQDSDCDDGLYCTGREACAGGSCVGTDPVLCDDGIACTEDHCDEDANACVSLPNNALCPSTPSGAPVCHPLEGCLIGQVCTTATECDDGNACTGVEDCVSGVCTFGTPIACASDGCLIGICNPDLGTCEQLRDDLACDDGAACTQDICKSDGLCENAPDHSLCADAVDCTEDVCEPFLGCQHLTMNARCDDGVPCTMDVCTMEGCLYEPQHSLCDDGIPCTIDSCLLPGGSVDVAGCSSRAADTFCAERALTMGLNSGCGAWFCAGDPLLPDGCGAMPNNLDCGIGSSCVYDTTGLHCQGLRSCTDPLDCSDGDPCNGDEYCDPGATGRCMPGVPPCDPTTGTLCELSYCIADASGTYTCATRINPECVPSDLDGDGFAEGIDCDDTNPSIHPGAPEICSDGLDNDCDGLPDNGC